MLRVFDSPQVLTIAWGFARIVNQSCFYAVRLFTGLAEILNGVFEAAPTPFDRAQQNPVRFRGVLATRARRASDRRK